MKKYEGYKSCVYYGADGWDPNVCGKCVEERCPNYRVVIRVTSDGTVQKTHIDNVNHPALERLTQNVTFKMLCVDDYLHFKKGVVYEAIDGIITYDDGSNSYYYDSYADFCDRNRILSKKTVELKDGDDVNEILKRYDNIKKGDKVKVINNGKTYATYSNWKGLKGYESHFVPKKSPDNGKTYRVLNVQKHDTYGRLIALIQDEDTTQVFIIGVNGLEKEV